MLGLTALNLFRFQIRSGGGLSQWPMAYIACFELLLAKVERCAFFLFPGRKLQRQNKPRLNLNNEKSGVFWGDD